MSDLVSRADVIEALHESGLCYDNWLEVRNEIDALQSGVVLCKDCVAYDEDGVCNCDSLYMHIMGESIDSFEPNENFFCQYGVRRE